MEEVGANIFSIPARSPDCNPIENVFNCVKAKLKEDALSLKITHESYADFSDWCRQTLLSFSVETNNRTYHLVYAEKNWFHNSKEGTEDKVLGMPLDSFFFLFAMFGPFQ